MRKVRGGVGLEFNHQESFRGRPGSGGGRQNTVVVAFYSFVLKVLF